jgi:anti-sigma regulatory factor (Ser/Thr protein kinase)
MKKQGKPAKAKARAGAQAKNAKENSAVSEALFAAPQEAPASRTTQEGPPRSPGSPETPANPPVLPLAVRTTLPADSETPGRVWKGELVAAARRDSLDAVQNFVRGYAERLDFSPQARMHVELAVEEIFVNIASYAYAAGETGAAAIRCEADAGGRRLTVVFADGGTPYNPLNRPDPDVGLSPEERPVGGLGIFITKRLMDAVDYRFEAGKNVLTMVKYVQSG